MSRISSILLTAVTTALAGCVTPAVVVNVASDALVNEAVPAERERSVLVARVEPLEMTPAVRPIEPARITLTQIVSQPPQGAAGAALVPQRIKPLREISLDISPPQLLNDQNVSIPLPSNSAAEDLPTLAQEQPFTRGELIAAGYEWHPSPQGLAFCYQPLYFEEVNLERYGHSWGCLQPFVSAVHFYSRIPALPYMVFARPARRCTYHAHWTLPGYKIPQHEPQPLVPSLTGAAAEVAVIYGIILLIP